LDPSFSLSPSLTHNFPKCIVLPPPSPPLPSLAEHCQEPAPRRRPLKLITSLVPPLFFPQVVVVRSDGAVSPPRDLWLRTMTDLLSSPPFKEPVSEVLLTRLRTDSRTSFYIVLSESGTSYPLTWLFLTRCSPPTPTITASPAGVNGHTPDSIGAPSVFFWYFSDGQAPGSFLRCGPLAPVGQAEETRSLFQQGPPPPFFPSMTFPR